MRRVSKLAAVRIRGSPDVRKKVLDTVRMLNLTRPHHCSLVEDTPSYRGMLFKAKGVLTWGPIRPDVLEVLLKKRGRLTGDKPLTDEVVSSSTSYDSIREFSKAVCVSEAELSEVPGLKKVFRLHPPRKGYKSTKHPFGAGGSLGDRGDAINDLILRMC